MIPVLKEAAPLKIPGRPNGLPHGEQALWRRRFRLRHFHLR
jgi:hypothetical protein